MTLVELGAADCATVPSSPERALHVVAQARSAALGARVTEIERTCEPGAVTRELQTMDRAMKSTAIDRERQTRPNEGKLWSDESDRLLLKRITKGDRDAFQALYEAYDHPLRRFIGKIAGLHDLAQEGVNDVMLVVWRNGASFNGRSKVSTWIMGIAYRKALKLRETSSRWTRRFKGVDDFDSWIEQSAAPMEPSGDGHLRDLLQQGLDRLSPEQRAVVELTYFNGCSYEEIAAIAGCPINTVKTRMFHARAKLRRLLPALGVERTDA